ncbi:hypothetical protein [Sulfurovum mangrovi]|uniref:hypothetical protein n=1 Tax=Sulfurovum mangrovi TaxID=2893889 RepID=UPI001E5C7727|nr:hypothetical protein [Sulfurovum mangrovi]UFH60468.1 hypothetical protein LN246_06320 [Sulfurovum mangrovi]
MQKILEKEHYKRPFFTTVILLLIVVILVRLFLLPLADPNLSLEWPKFIASLLDKFSTSLIVTIFIGIFIFWFTPKIVKKSKMEVLEPKEISKLLKNATQDSRSWIFKGATGRYTRSSTLPLMAEAARHESIGRDIRICLINPDNTKLCEEYATYRRSLKSASKSKPWDSKRVQNEVIATIVSALITQHDEPLLRITIHLIDTFSSFRLDISDFYVVITKEDKEATALRADIGTYFYDSYKDEVRLIERQSKKVTIDEEISSLDKVKFTENELKEYLQHINILPSNDIENLDLKTISNLIKNPENPYA